VARVLLPSTACSDVSNGRELEMKSLLVLIAIALFGLYSTACGRAGSAASPTPPPSRAVTSRAGVSGLQGDGDSDNPLDIDEDSHDGAEDQDDDSKTPESYDYHDKDDRATLSFGHVPTAANRAAITAVAAHYYAALAAKNGATTCSLLLSSLAQSVPEDYAGGAAPAYLRGGKTCQTVLSMLSKHFHAQLAGTIKVTGVRVDGNHAEVLIGSTTMPASDIAVMREGKAWKVAELLGSALP
jgi:hypothetical protein